MTYSTAIGSAVDVAVGQNSDGETDVGGNDSPDQSDGESQNPPDSPVSVMCRVEVT